MECAVKEADSPASFFITGTSQINEMGNECVCRTSVPKENFLKAVVCIVSFSYVEINNRLRRKELPRNNDRRCMKRF